VRDKVQKIYLDETLRVEDLQGDLTKYDIFANLRKGESFLDGLPKLYRKELTPACQLALEEGKTTESEFRTHTLDRNKVILSFRVEPVVQKGKISGVSVVATDVSEEKRWQQLQELKEKMENLSILASNISHELNNPIAALLNQIGRLLMENLTAKDLPRLRQELHDIQEQIYAMSIVTNALDAFSKDAQNHFRLLNINSVLEKSIELSKLLQIKNDVNYHVKLSPDLPPVFGNEITLEQSFINIIRNALEAMPDGGDLTVTSSIDKINPDYIQIVIKDTGVGIPREDLERIYDPFYKGKEGDHAGLGLSISYGIIANHDGNIQIKSRVNKGTTLTIILPRGKRL